MSEKPSLSSELTDRSTPLEVKVDQILRVEAASDILPFYNPCQDAILVDASSGLGGVFDGVGGTKRAEIASATATETIGNYYAGASEPTDLEAAKELLYFALVRADEQIKAVASTLNLPEVPQTTAAVAKLWRDPASGDYKLLAASSGDSRVYVLDPEGVLSQVTVDNVDDTTSDVDVQDAQLYQSETSNILDPLNSADETYFNTRHFLGPVLGLSDADLEPRIEVVAIGTGYKVLITTDGVHDNLTDNEIRELLAAPLAASEMVKSITGAARDRSAHQDFARAKTDDISAVVLLID